MRSTRKQSFCWQEKKINRLIRKEYTGSERVKMLLLYATITEIDSDFNQKNIKYYTKTIATYSGLSKDFIPTGLRRFEKMHILTIIGGKDKGKFKGKKLVFTPEKIDELPRKTVAGKSLNGKSLNGNNEPSEDSIVLEDSSLKEELYVESVASIKKNSNSEANKEKNSEKEEYKSYFQHKKDGKMLGFTESEELDIARKKILYGFRKISPSVESLSENKQQQQAFLSFCKKWGYERLIEVVVKIELMRKWNAEGEVKLKSLLPFKINTPIKFLYNLDELEALFEKVVVEPKLI